MANAKMPLGVTAVMLPELDFDEQIALCQRLGVTHYCLRPRVIPGSERGKPWGNWGNHKFDLTPQRLVKEGDQIKRKLQAAGLEPFGSVPGLLVSASAEDLHLHFEGAAAVGAGRVRVQPLPYPKNQAFDYQDLLQRTIKEYERVLVVARKFQQKVVIETHCQSLASTPPLALNILKQFDSREAGVIFDIANFHIEGALIPNLAVAVMGDYIDHVHIGGSRMVSQGYDANGFCRFASQGTAMTEAQTSIPDWLAALRDAGRLVPLVIEDYTAGMPGALRLERSATELRRLPLA